MPDGYLYAMGITIELILFALAPAHHYKLALEGRVGTLELLRAVARVDLHPGY